MTRPPLWRADSQDTADGSPSDFIWDGRHESAFAWTCLCGNIASRPYRSRSRRGCGVKIGQDTGRRPGPGSRRGANGSASAGAYSLVQLVTGLAQIQLWKI